MSLGSLNARSVNHDTLDGGRTGIYVSDIPIADICLGEFNAAPVNAYEVNGCRFLASLGVQSILAFNQLVGVQVIGSVVTFQQAVELKVSISGTVVSFAQNNVQTLSADTAISISQLVDAPGSFLDVHGWDATISINNIELPKNVIVNNLTISKESNQNTICNFKVKVTDPLDFIETIDGEDIIINYFTASGGYRLFTGFVDSPEIDLIDKSITIRCSDRREDLIKDLLNPSGVHRVATTDPTGSFNPILTIGSLGTYHPAVQGRIASVDEYTAYSMQTIPNDLDFDAYNKPNLNSWFANSVADYVYDNSDVYYRKPELTWQDKGSIVNDISIEVIYTYPRLYHYQRPFTWTTTSPPALLVSGEHEDGFSFPTVKMIKGSIEGANWKDNGTLTYTESVSNYWTVPTPEINIAPPHQTIIVPVIYHVQNVDDYEVTTASWEGSTRFAQTIEETFTLNVKSAASISKYSSITSFANYSLAADYNTSQWEAYKTLAYSDAFPATTAVMSEDSYYYHKDINRTELNKAMSTALNKARVQILAGHRTTRVSAQIVLQPELELRHTVEIDTSTLSCKGKVVAIKHTLDFANRKSNDTEVIVALFRSPGNGADTVLNPPGAISAPVTIPSSLITLGNHLGYNWDETAESIRDTWNGFVGNTIPPLVYTNFPEKFIVDTPAAPPELRDTKKVAATIEYNVAIPNDDLDIIF